MPVRSSVCTYSPSSLSTNKLGSNYSPSSLSIGHYKTLNSTPPLGRANNFAASNYSTSSSYRQSPTRLNSSNPTSQRFNSSPSSSSAYGTSSFKSNPYSSSLSSSGSTTSTASSSSTISSYSGSPYYSNSASSPISARYKPLNSPSTSFTVGRTFGSNATATSTPARYSSASLNSSNSSNELLSSSSYHSPLSTSSFRSSRFSPSNRRLSNSYSTTTSSQNESLPAGVPRGLINLGNTCYMNSVIQALYSVESFRNLILRASHDKILTSELSDLFKSMKNSSSPISPSNFKYAFSRYQAKFSGLGQQDAQEFLRYLINGIHEELNQVRSNHRSRSSSSATATRPPRSAAEAWQQYRDIVDDSPLVDLLVGQLCSTIVCSVCSNKSHCWDPFWDLSLPLVRGKYSLKLDDVLVEFTAKETLDSDERPICESCKKATKSTKQISLSRLPQVLILHLKKFTNEGYKLTSPEITIDERLTFNRTTTYHLKACISHHGHSSSSGHYTSHCEYSNKWFHFNDDRVRDVTGSFDSSKLDDAYVLIYTQTTSQQSKL